MSEWFIKKALDMPPAPGAGAPALDGASMKSLDELRQERAITPPPVPNPTGNPEPVEPMSLKSLAQLFESAAKSALDAKLNMEKTHVALSKVGAMKSQTDKDREIAARAGGYVEEAKKLTNTTEALAKSIEAMRDGVSKPASPWLE